MARKKRENVTEDSVSVMVQQYLSSSLGYSAGALSIELAANLNYYNGTPNGATIASTAPNKETSSLGTNRSQYNSSDCFDKVEQAIPLLMKPFCGDEIVEVSATEPEKEEIADQQRDLLNYCFFKQNQGFLLLQSAMRDALVSKIGVFKAYWDERVHYEDEDYDNINDEEYLELIQDPNVEILKHEFTEDEELVDGIVHNIKTHSTTIKRKIQNSYPRIECFAPENFLVTGKQISLDLKDCEFCAQRIFATRETLVELDIDPKFIDLMPDSNLNMQNVAQVARYSFPEQQSTLMTLPSNLNEARRPIQLYECYMRYDSDGDGLTELHQIFYSSNKVLKDTIVSDVPFFAITPILQPHQFYGKALVDVVRQDQEVKSILIREALNNFYYSNIPVTGYDANRIGKDGLDTLLYREPGSSVATDGPPAEILTFFPPVFTADSTLQLVQYFDTALQAKTGISAMMAGLDSEVLNNNKGDSSMLRVMDASEERIALIAKTFASTGLKDLFYYVAKLFIRHQKESMTLRLRGSYVKVDPKSWNSPMDITIKVGIGVNQKQKQIAALGNVLQSYQTLAQGGQAGILFNQTNVYRALTDLAKDFGIDHPEQYYLDPVSDESKQAAQAQQSQQAPPDPQLQLIQLQAENDKQRIQIDAQKLALQKEKQDQDYKIEIEKLSQNAKKLELDHLKAMEELKIKSSQGQDRMALDMASEVRNIHNSIESNSHKHVGSLSSEHAEIMGAQSISSDKKSARGKTK